MKLSELKGEEALDVLADLIEPAAEIMTDKEVVDAVRSGATLKGVKKAIKNHKRAVITMLAVLDRQDPEQYTVNFVTLPVKLLELMNDLELKSLFISQGQKGDAASSGSVSENIEKAV